MIDDLISQALAEEQQCIPAVVGGASGGACLSHPPYLSHAVSAGLKDTEYDLGQGEMKTYKNPHS